MYAVIETGGKQYKVEPGMRIRVEKLDIEPGSTVEFTPLMVRKDSGELEFGKGKVVAEVLSHGKGKKIIVFKYRPKKNYKRWKGHRQWYTELLIREIKE
ncbi:MAG: 50S ribosomal protein L21 [Aquificota bacterium]|nr:50S ribosomal protein L21 [Aquificota bacterium]MDQ7082835.1 50S ribosomal protein L21 [Aquificota bacterium]